MLSIRLTLPPIHPTHSFVFSRLYPERLLPRFIHSTTSLLSRAVRYFYLVSGTMKWCRRRNRPDPMLFVIIAYNRYPTREHASQNSEPPTSLHPSGPKSHSAQDRSFICGVVFIARGFENPMFSNCIGLGEISHQFVVSGGMGSAGNTSAGGGSFEESI